MKVDEWEQEVVSGAKNFSERKFGKLLMNLDRGDTIHWMSPPEGLPGNGEWRVAQRPGKSCQP
jgi:hypothetical protein